MYNVMARVLKTGSEAETTKCNSKENYKYYKTHDKDIFYPLKS
jgi:hypothetical protein